MMRPAHGSSPPGVGPTPFGLRLHSVGPSPGRTWTHYLLPNPKLS